MRSLCIADLHLTSNPKEAYRHNFMRKHLMKIARRETPDQIIIAGDLTEQKDKHSAWLVNKVADYIAWLAELAPVVVLEGNHDYEDSREPFFRFTRHMTNVRYFDRVTRDGKYLFLPFTHAPEQDWAGVKPSKIIIAHQLFEGALSNGMQMRGVNQKLLPPADVVLAGDVHTPQRIGRVHYIGAPYTVDFGDDYKPRLVMLNGTTIESIDVSMFPQKRLIDATRAKDLDKLHELNKGDMVRLRLHVNSSEEMDAMQELATQAIVENDLVVWSIERITARKAVRRNHVVTTTATDDEALEAFGKRHSVHERVLKVGRNLL